MTTTSSDTTYQCSTCGLATPKRADRKAHSLATGHDYYAPVAPVAAPVTRSAWDDQVDAVVAAGYGRAFAEASTPMTLAEVRRRGLAAQGYTSPMTALMRRRAK